MTNHRGIERRRHPRVEQRLPLRIVANGYDFLTTTHNISCLGTYCRLDKYIPPFTKIAVRLTLPVSARKEKDDFRVECKGVVVRSEDNQDGGFNIAIFFNEIADTQRKKISQYISKLLH
ncbi:PilZ domain-containing protein [bacterium]|nr:MAG: PilZ domain-containing protein [bacterium]